MPQSSFPASSFGPTVIQGLADRLNSRSDCQQQAFQHASSLTITTPTTAQGPASCFSQFVKDNCFLEQIPNNKVSGASSSSSPSSSSSDNGSSDKKEQKQQTTTTTTTTTTTNSKTRTSMRQFWCSHIIINNRIIDLDKLEPTIGVKAWETTGIPKKYNEWCKHLVKDGKCKFGNRCYNAHPKQGSTMQAIEDDSPHVEVLEFANHSQSRRRIAADNTSTQTSTTTSAAAAAVNDRFAALRPSTNTTSTSLSTTTASSTPEKPTSAAFSTFPKSSKQQQQLDELMQKARESKELITVWRQRTSTAVLYPLCRLNEESLRRHYMFDKTVSECYFQHSCKDSLCTFIHLDERFVQPKSQKTVAVTTTNAKSETEDQQQQQQ